MLLSQERTGNNWEEAQSDILQEFKTVIEFYRMEYSEDLLTLFNEFGYLLLCALAAEREGEKENHWLQMKGGEVKQGSRLADILSAGVGEEYLRHLEQEFRSKTEYDVKFTYLREFQRRIMKATVLRPMLFIIAGLLRLQWKEEFAGFEVYFKIMRKILDLCVNTKLEQGRYLMPDDMVGKLVALVQADGKLVSKGEKIKVLDPRCGSGSMLIAAKRSIENGIMYGYEQDEKFLMSLEILSYLSGTVIEVKKEGFHGGHLADKFDIILANPPFNSATILSDNYLFQEPLGELGEIKGQYNRMLVQSLEALKQDGWAAFIVPDSFLFTSRKENKVVREWMLKKYQVEAIIGLPAKTFYPHANVHSSVIILSHPVMKEGWGDFYTESVFFYQLKSENWEQEYEKEFERLFETWKKRGDFYQEWNEKKAQSVILNVDEITTPEHWDYSDFWYADMETIMREECCLIPERYKPAERISLQFEMPEQIIIELLKEQENIVSELHELLEEVGGL